MTESKDKAVVPTIRVSVNDTPVDQVQVAARGRRTVQGFAPDKRHQPRLTNLYVNVVTINNKDQLVNEKVADLMNVGTTAWLMKHMVWAASQGHRIEQDIATPEQIDEYVKRGIEALHDRYAG